MLDMPVDAQDVASGGQLVALITAGVAAIERSNISQRAKQRLERAPAEGKMAGRALEHLPGTDAHHTTNEAGPGHVLGPDHPLAGYIGIAGAASSDD